MSTCNFVMQKNFPLYAYDIEANLAEMWYCPETGKTHGELAKEGRAACRGCVYFSSPVGNWSCRPGRMPDWFRQDKFEELENELDELVNPGFKHWNVHLTDGYYTDWQLVAYLRDLPREWHRREWPEDVGELWSMYGDEEDDARIQAEAAAEIEGVRRAMEEFAQAHGFTPLELVGVFSNGEAIYLAKEAEDEAA